jgi:tight adherence protein B
MRLRRSALLAAMAATWIMLLAAPAFAQDTGGSVNETLVIVGAAAAGVAAFGLIWILFGGGDAGIERDIRGRLGSYAPEQQIDRGLLGRIPGFRRFARSAERVAERRGLLGVIETALEQGNLPIRPGEAIAGAIGIAILIGVIFGAASGNIIWGAVAAGLTLMVAVVLVQGVAGRQRNKFISQLPDTLNLISTSLRAGYSLLQALDAVSAEAPQPTAREFGRAISEIRLGRSPTEALKDIADRMQSVDFDWAVLAINIQREVGGNLAEVLQTTSETMLARNRLRREVKALTAEGRISAIVLGALPFVLFAFLFTTRREYLEPLLQNGWGVVALIGAVIWLIVGIAWLTRIVKVEI